MASLVLKYLKIFNYVCIRDKYWWGLPKFHRTLVCKITKSPFRCQHWFPFFRRTVKLSPNGGFKDCSLFALFFVLLWNKMELALRREIDVFGLEKVCRLPFFCYYRQRGFRKGLYEVDIGLGWIHLSSRIVSRKVVSRNRSYSICTGDSVPSWWKERKRNEGFWGFRGWGRKGDPKYCNWYEKSF